MQKLRVLILIDWYLPGYKAGGPIKSIAAMVSRLQDRFEFSIVTTNRDFGESKPYDSVPSDVWVQLSENVKAWYFSAEKLDRQNLLSVIEQVQPDRIYLNSFFSWYFSICPLLLRKRGKIKVPVILAPRGMLGEGALGIKPFKKKLFILFARLTGLHRNITWHSTSEEESGEIRSVFGESANIRRAGNLQYKKEIKPPAPARKENVLKLYYLSRISEKKNLLYALEVLSELDKSCRVELNIIGPAEDAAYWSKCRERISSMPSSVKVNIIGAIRYENIPEAIAAAHFLFLPTKNENYGHVIVEAWMNGKPVIISDQTPWKNLQEKDLGWEIPLDDKQKFIRTIEECAGMTQESYDRLSRSSAAYGERCASDEQAAADTAGLFLQ
jgi:glycosyltransferase involved in cell wall biosynthesis